MNSPLVIFLKIHMIILLSFFVTLARADVVNNNDAERQFSFAETLFEEGDYYRAITEYKRFNFFFADHRLIAKSNYRIGESYYMAKRWQEAIESFTLFISQHPQRALSIDALYLKGMAEKQLKRYHNALKTFQEIINLKSSTYTDKALYQSAIILMDMEECEKARKTFLLIPKESPLSISSHIISSGLEHINEIPQKSPALAGTLAAILPGAGHLYTERLGDSLVSFVLNGAFILAAVELFHHENYITGGIVSFFEIGWYSGNIYSAISSAHKYNKKTREDFLEHLKESGMISFAYDPVSSANYLKFSFRF
jgi:hypothetical protein